jgi:hypothetical protein
MANLLVTGAVRSPAFGTAPGFKIRQNLKIDRKSFYKQFNIIFNK